MIYRFGGFELDRARFRLARGEEPVRLKPLVLDVLVYPVERQGQLVTRQELLRELWNDRFVGDAALTSCVYEARRVLGDATGDPGGGGSQRFIQTVHGRGYRFAAGVETVDDGETIGLEAPSATDSAPPAVARGHDPSIAVLAFEDMSPDRDQAYFAEGVAEAILNALSRVDGLRVMARTSAFALRRENLTAQQIGERLAVSSVLEGSVQRAGDRVRISAHLIQTRDGFHRWSETYDRSLGAIFEVQDEIARAVVAEVAPQLRRSHGHRGALVERATESQEAYDLYLLSFTSFRKQTEAGLEAALELIERAIELDPDFVGAHWWKGLIHHFLVVNGHRSWQGWAKAEAALRRALALDGDLAFAHATLGEIRAFNWDWRAADEHGRRAIELLPGSSLTQMEYAIALSATGRTRQAVEHLERARVLDPLNSLLNRNLGYHLIYDRQYERAIRQLRYSLALSGELPFTRLALLDACWLEGEYGQWAQELQQIYRGLGSKDEAERIGRLFETSGPRAVLRWWVEHLTASEEHSAQLGRLGDPNALRTLAYIQVRLGDLEGAFSNLERLVDRRSILVHSLKVHPILDPLRDDPRYLALLRRMNLAD